jgi:uridine phosphorylase
VYGGRSYIGPVPAVLVPTAAPAADVLLPGDPGRALALAQELLVAPKMSNHAHGLWGYSGETPQGEPLTIQATGIGAPSAALVLGDLAELGVRRAVAVGTCVALSEDLGICSTLLCARALAGDGTSRALGAGEAVDADAGLTGALAALPGAPTAQQTVATADVLHADGDGVPAALRERWLAAGAVAAEMQAATLFAAGPRLGISVAALLVVTDGADGREGDPAALEEASSAAGALAARALGDGGAG